MRISKHELLLDLKEHFKHDADEMPHCMINCHDCDMSDECARLDKYMPEIFEESEKVMAEPKNQKTAQPNIKQEEINNIPKYFIAEDKLLTKWKT